MQACDAPYFLLNHKKKLLAKNITWNECIDFFFLNLSTVYNNKLE